jgi:hypothetical protein
VFWECLVTGDHDENRAFEAEVRRVAEAVWDQLPGACQPRQYSDNPAISELDGLVRLPDVTHLLMSTTSTRLDDCEDDVRKLIAAEKIERSLGAPAVAKWYITSKQLNATHVDHCRRNNVTALSIRDFRRRFFDGAKYLARRQDAAFGSARNPKDDSINIAPNSYVSLPLQVVTRPSTWSGGNKKDQLIDLDSLESLVLSGAKVVLVGPFGAGKSLTTRELFGRLAEKNRLDEGSPIPITLNLREHWGQQYSDEILERHSRSIGFSPKESLVVAWRAGMATLLLDGFDEVASQAVVRRDDKNFMRGARREALTGVRDFLTKLPSRTGVFICGRDHYFDSPSEMEHALGLRAGQYHVLKLDEFDEEGAKAFLAKNGVTQALPDWLPRKPLMLAYLVQHGLFEDVVKIDSGSGFGMAWDSFLKLVTEREAQLENAAMDPVTLRNVLERIAFLARSRPSGVGPISGTDLSEAYGQETGQPANEGVLAQLQRLPGLTQRDQEPGLRSFVDEDFLAALQGSAFAKLVQGLFTGHLPDPIDVLSDKACTMASHILRKFGITANAVVAAAPRIGEHLRRLGSDQTVADACALSLHMAQEEERETLDFHGVVLDLVNLSRIDLDTLAVDGLTIRNSVIRELLIGQMALKSSIRFENCHVVRVGGVSQEQGLPSSLFGTGCTFETFDSYATTSAVQQMSLPAELRALLTILRKLYKQAGGGRKIAALHRGITHPDVAEYIDDVIQILEQEDFVTIYNKVVHPVRRRASRVERILRAPSLSQDPLVIRVRGINSPP